MGQVSRENRNIMATRFEDWLSAEMNRKGWSQAQLARESKVSRQTISYWFSGKSKQPDEFSLEKIAHALGVPIEDAYRAAGLPVSSTNRDTWVRRVENKLSQITDEKDRETIEGLIDILAPDKKARAGRRTSNNESSP
jgi:transcriptional regulator with XRE-family HTH domain